MVQLSQKDMLDGGDRGWLKAGHHFVVSVDGNPEDAPLGSLVVWNDDEIAPGKGFGKLRHAELEIITLVRQSAGKLEDSTGNRGKTIAGDL